MGAPAGQNERDGYGAERPDRRCPCQLPVPPLPCPSFLDHAVVGRLDLPLGAARGSLDQHVLSYYR